MDCLIISWVAIQMNGDWSVENYWCIVSIYWWPWLEPFLPLSAVLPLMTGGRNPDSWKKYPEKPSLDGEPVREKEVKIVKTSAIKRSTEICCPPPPRYFHLFYPDALKSSQIPRYGISWNLKNQIPRWTPKYPDLVENTQQRQRCLSPIRVVNGKSEVGGPGAWEKASESVKKSENFFWAFIFTDCLHRHLFSPSTKSQTGGGGGGYRNF